MDVQDATVMLPADKVVTQEDAAKVREAELRGGQGEVVPGGVAASMQAAADLNERAGLLAATETHGIRDVKNIPVQHTSSIASDASKSAEQAVKNIPVADASGEVPPASAGA